MKIDEYIWVMCDAIREDGDVSLFFVLDEMINYLSGCKSKKKKDMLKCLQRCRVILDEMERLVYGEVKHGRLYQFVSLRNFYNECCNNNNQTMQTTIDELYRRACKELDDFEMIYCAEFSVNANEDVSNKWLSTVPDEAFKG